MDVKVNIGGMEATISVANAQEAAELLRSISNLPGSTQHTAVNSGTSTMNPKVTDTSPSANDTTSTENITVRNLCEALRPLAGSTGAKTLMILLHSSSTPTPDAEIKDALGIGPDGNLGPVFSSISKAFQRAGIAYESMIERHTRKGKKGKVHYWFGLTPTAKKALSAMPDFDKEIALPLFTRPHTSVEMAIGQLRQLPLKLSDAAEDRRFANMRQIDAAEQILSEAGRPMKTGEISKALLEGGFHQRDSKKLTTSLFTSLTRKPEVFRKAGTGLWDLSKR